MIGVVRFRHNYHGNDVLICTSYQGAREVDLPYYCNGTLLTGLGGVC